MDDLLRSAQISERPVPRLKYVARMFLKEIEKRPVRFHVILKQADYQLFPIFCIRVGAGCVQLCGLISVHDQYNTRNHKFEIG